MTYLDSSVLVKAFVEEPGSRQALRLVRGPAVIATSALTYAEIISALRRKLRESLLKETDYERVARELDRSWREFDVVPVSNDVLRQARRMLERYPLRAGDAIQLGSAVLISVFSRVVFASDDKRLTAAAKAEGLDVLV